MGFTAKVKKGEEILYMPGNHWKNLSDTMIVNLSNKWIYKNFRQKKNHLLLDTTEGEIDIVFTGEVPILYFESGEKDQLIFRTTYK